MLDDPDDHESRHESHQRQHGTEMASIILHGDGRAPSSLPHRLYVRPVLIPYEVRDGRFIERFTEDMLAVYVVY